jgi:ABC-type transporter lipoprotein component MlaA
METKELFKQIFGADILEKEFDADMYKGGAYIEVINNKVYILELSWECDTLNLKTLEDIKNNLLLDIVISESEEDYYLIGKIFAMERNMQSENDKLKKSIELIYEREAEWMLESLLTKNILININEW